MKNNQNLYVVSLSLICGIPPPCLPRSQTAQEPEKGGIWRISRTDELTNKAVDASCRGFGKGVDEAGSLEGDEEGF